MSLTEKHHIHKTRHVLKFTKEEDDFLKEGITKHGFGALSKEKGRNENVASLKKFGHSLSVQRMGVRRVCCTQKRQK